MCAYENQVLCLRAITDCNLPKFVTADVPLFRGITQDLFPGVSLPPPDYAALHEAMCQACAVYGLQVPPLQPSLESLADVFERFMLV